MKIKIEHHTNMFWVLCHSFEIEDEAKTDAIFSNKESMIFDVEFKVNGVEFDFQKVCDTLIVQYRKYVDDEVKRIYQNKLDVVINKLNDMSTYADDILKLID